SPFATPSLQVLSLPGGHVSWWPLPRWPLTHSAWYNDPMTHKRRIVTRSTPARWYRGANIPMRVIRRFARQVGERFQPEKIILFGSYAYGTPHADSDVDILVVMPARQQHTQAVRIRWAIPAPFP